MRCYALLKGLAIAHATMTFFRETIFAKFEPFLGPVSDDFREKKAFFKPNPKKHIIK